MTAYNPNCNFQPCEFTIPIDLNIPITIRPNLNVVPPTIPLVKHQLPVYLAPAIALEPAVSAQKADCECLPPANGC